MSHPFFSRPDLSTLFNYHHFACTEHDTSLSLWLESGCRLQAAPPFPYPAAFAVYSSRHLSLTPLTPVWICFYFTSTSRGIKLETNRFLSSVVILKESRDIAQLFDPSHIIPLFVWGLDGFSRRDQTSRFGFVNKCSTFCYLLMAYDRVL